ncbi:beta-ketoacyl-ACP synthase II [Oxalicibacterium solurbis]|uniref:Beta-ketoacyl-ACP synthase II n=2 Tax=Oxalicibacterium solurbis TaxID=69280 RepID=A0A8J3AY54_9BURK|nr:beta-ketoacyl-ACP synthase II [Oxalicibacterium solurbis]
MEEWADYEGLNTRLGAPAVPFSLSDRFNRKTMRSMGRIALMATCASEMALQDAGLLDDPLLQSGKMGVSFGSSAGTPSAIGDFGRMMEERTTKGINATTYIKMMAHTAPVNIGVFFGVTGRVFTTSSACTSGSQGIGYAYEAIRTGKQLAMIAGGAEELCATEAAVFDTLFATSVRNDEPAITPRPFDANRDGLVIGEGAGCLILEELEHAKARGATIYAEVVGFGTNSDGCHVTQPNAETMKIAMQLALDDARLQAADIGYVNAHGTGTMQGDIAESQATFGVFGRNVPISSLKSYMGHTLGACGALEAWISIEMMRDGWFAPTINLEKIDPQCAELDYIVDAGRTIACDYVMSNNFAFGGINTSLIFKRYC